MLNQESILKEISLALHQRKRLNGQVSKLNSELTSLERTGATAAVSSSSFFPPRPPSSTQLLQSSFTSSAQLQNGLAPSQPTMAVMQQQQYQSNNRAPPPLQASPQHQQHQQQQPTTQQRKPSSAGSMRRNQEWPDIPEISKIEEKNPEILAQKILETGRQIEAVKYGTELTPRVHQTNNSVGQPVENNKKERKVPPMKIQRQPGATKASTAPSTTPPIGSKNCKMNSMPADTTPRVNDFEDRLKNLITSVLNDNSPSPASTSSPIPPPVSDALKQQFAVPEREGLFARAPMKSSLTSHHVQPSQPDYTQFSPAKLALRRHLSQERLYAPSKQHQSPSESYVRTIGDLVTGEIERSLEISSTPSRTYSPISRPGSTDTSKEGFTQPPASSTPTSAEPRECEEGLAASLRDRIRVPAEEILEKEVPQPVLSEAEENTTPSKRKRPSTETTGQPAKKNAKWQDKISQSFDRMMAFASTEMDKRRRSTESCSPRTEPFSSPRGKDGMPAPSTSTSTSKEATPVHEPEISKTIQDEASSKQSCSSTNSTTSEDLTGSRKEKHSSSRSSDKKREKSSEHDRSSK